MASISKRKNKWVVIYYYEDENGERKQKWETYDSNAEAKKRKAEIEYEQQQGTFIVPTAKTVADLMDDYVTLYGTNAWALSTYNHSMSLINNYILPIIGDVKLDDLNTRMMEKYYQSLLKVKSKCAHGVSPKHQYLQPSNIKKIHKLLNSCFNQAVKWEIISKNPCTYAIVPHCEYKERKIWDADTLFKAIELCEDDVLKLALNLAFSCCLRMGEMLALTWDCIDISDKSIINGTAHIYVKKELQRVDLSALETLGEKDVIYRFPATMTRNTTALVLKAPKTRSSVRKIFLPRTVAEMLIERKERIEEFKELFGKDFFDYGLVFCHPDGKPMENQVITRLFKKLIIDNDLPPVVFHSLRHTSITYKLKINGGDMKSVQGDSGHSQMKMVADVYAHIIDDDRKNNARKFEEEFYTGKEKQEEILDPTPLPTSESSSSASTLNTLLKIMQNPEAAELLKELAKSL